MKLSSHFSAADLLYAGETCKKIRPRNTPIQLGTWSALRQLCSDVLEPVRSHFGHPTITYCFASHDLTRHIKNRISPKLDQHAGFELRPDGSPVCPRLGQAVDFYVDGVSSAVVAYWIAQYLRFDRLYYYGASRPLHVSVGPDNSRGMVAMLSSQTGRRMPRRITLDWLSQEAIDNKHITPSALSENSLD